MVVRAFLSKGRTGSGRGVGLDVFVRYTDSAGHDTLPEGVIAMIDAQAPKRVALEFTETRRASWDHRKLQGIY